LSEAKDRMRLVMAQRSKYALGNWMGSEEQLMPGLLTLRQFLAARMTVW
jgi:hypothetical protein